MCTGPVGLAETNSRFSRCPANSSVLSVGLPRCDRLDGDLAQGALRGGDVEEARAGDVDRCDAVGARAVRAASSSATSRGGRPAGLASRSATLVA